MIAIILILIVIIAVLLLRLMAMSIDNYILRDEARAEREFADLEESRYHTLLSVLDRYGMLQDVLKKIDNLKSRTDIDRKESESLEDIKHNIKYIISNK